MIKKLNYVFIGNTVEKDFMRSSKREQFWILILNNLVFV
jgi:hypothetical protein